MEHGCPYKHWDGTQLEARLRQLKIDTPTIKNIVESATTKNYQVACRKHWEASHKGGDSDMVGNHPNAWFEASMTHHRKPEAGEGDTATGDTATPAGEVTKDDATIAAE